jgi:sugar lactone lactonase YvrE
MRRTNLLRMVCQIAGLLLVVACAALPSRAQCLTSVTVLPTGVFFGPQTVRTTSASQTVTFSVTTSCPSAVVTLNTFTIGGADASEFGATGSGTSPCTQPITLTATSTVPASCTVSVEFTPAATSTRSGALSFTYVPTTVPPSTAFTQTVNLVGGDEVVFVSTQSGGQILAVDGTTGAFGVVSNGPGCGESLGCFQPEGIVVGPDGKLYITDPTNQQITRMNQDGTQPEIIYTRNCSGCPGAPQGPTFNSSATGDLYFNTEANDFREGVWSIPGVGTTPPFPDGGFNSPLNIVPGACTGTCFTFGNGAGTAFDNADNLLFVEQAVGGSSNPDSVLSVSPPYSGNPSTLVSGLTNPTAVALNRATGQLFVSDTGTQRILAIGSDGTTTYFTFTSSTTCVASESGLLPDLPVFMQFDGTGHLFVVTTTSPFGNGCGKVWRIDPGATPTATPLLDLQAAAAVAVTGLTSSQAIGLALPGTQGPTQTAGLSSAAGSFNFGWPVGCHPNLIPTDCTYTFGVSYLSGTFPDGSTASVFPTITSEFGWALRTPPGNLYNGTLIAPVAGENGGGPIFSAQCLLGGSPCPVPNPALTYTVATTWKSSQPGYCTSGPGLLKADPIGSNNWVDTLNNCTVISPDPTYGGKGTSKCTSSSCLSDWANVFDIMGIAPVVTITTPPSAATYSLNQVVDANYSCTPPAGTFQVTACSGTVPSGNPIDTSSPGTKTFLATADVSSGPAGSKSTTYNVTSTQFIGFSAPISNTDVNLVNAGQTIPIGFQVLGGNNNPVLNLDMPPVAITFAPAGSCSGPTTMITTMDASGNSGFQNLGGGFYQFNWKTMKSMAGTCGTLQVNVGDGVLHTAQFQFK